MRCSVFLNVADWVNVWLVYGSFCSNFLVYAYNRIIFVIWLFINSAKIGTGFPVFITIVAVLRIFKNVLTSINSCLFSYFYQSIGLSNQLVTFQILSAFLLLFPVLFECFGTYLSGVFFNIYLFIFSFFFFIYSFSSPFISFFVFFDFWLINIFIYSLLIYLF